MRAQNRDLLRGNCRVIWLKATLEESVLNPEWAYMTASRPLLAGGDREKITKLWESRIPVYESVADYTLVTSGLAPETIVDTLATIARSFIR
jgi:shikimate kinase